MNNTDPTFLVTAKEVCALLCSIVLAGAEEKFLANVQKAPKDSGLNKIAPITAVYGGRQTNVTADESTFYNFFASESSDAVYALTCHSLAIKIDNVAPGRADALVGVLERNPTLANLLMSALACSRNKSLASTHFLSVQLSDPYQVVAHGAKGASVFVDIFDADPTNINGANICTAVNKCIKHFKRTLWHLRRRVIVMCLSNNLAVDIELVNPGTTASCVQIRKKLVDRLSGCQGFPAPKGFVFGPCRNRNVYKYLVFSYGKGLHELTNKITQDYFRSLGVKVNRQVNFEVTLDVNALK